MKSKSVAAANWREATAVLISRTAVQGARKFVSANRPNAVPLFLIEDSRLLKDGLASMLRPHGFELIGTVHNHAEVLRDVKRLEPELVLVGSSISHRDGVDLVEAIKKVSPEIKVVVMHLEPVQDDVVRFVRAGVSGFIEQNAPLAEFVTTIRAVAEGASVLPPLMTQALFSHVAAQAKARTRPKGWPPSSAR